MSKPDRYNVIIVGAGPSGLSTALHIARDFPHLTDRILILEKAHHPRPKLCAGGLVADAEIILQRLGLDVTEVPHVNASTAHFDFAGKGLTISLPNTHTLRIIRRDEFDAWLAKKAMDRGIEIREGVNVKNIEPRDDCVIVETDSGIFTAQVVVGADGSNGVTRRCVMPDAPVHTARALEVITPPSVLVSEATQSPSRRKNPIVKFGPFYRGLLRREERLPHNDIHGSDEAYFDFFPVPDGIAGYTWDFPTQVNGEPMRCWGVYDTNLLSNMERPALREALAEEMARHGFNLEDVELKGHPIRWFSPKNQMSVPRVLLVGDAVGADAIFGEGISMALGYGFVAAQEIGESFQRNEFSFNGYKRRVARSALGRTLMVRWFITQILYHLRWRRFQSFFWRRMGWLIGPVAWLLVLNWGRRMKR